MCVKWRELRIWILRVLRAAEFENVEPTAVSTFGAESSERERERLGHSGSVSRSDCGFGACG